MIDMIDTVKTAVFDFDYKRAPIGDGSFLSGPLRPRGQGSILQKGWCGNGKTDSKWDVNEAMLSCEAAADIRRLRECDLRFLEEQLTWKDGYDATFAHECVEEYRKWIALHIAMHDSDFVEAYFSGTSHPLGMPSKYVDNAWHRHILFTKEYIVFCESVAGRMIHHNPCTRRNVATMNADATRKAYHILFGDIPEIWNASESFLANGNSAGCGCGCSSRD